MPLFCPEFSDDETAAIIKEFSRLNDNAYLDHAGTTLYSEAQVDAVTKFLKENLFCNPHTCKLTADLVNQVRHRILNHFNADAAEYAVVFTANATAALKIVGECFHFGANTTESRGGFYYCQENHTSVLGMREVVNCDRIYVLTKDELEENTGGGCDWKTASSSSSSSHNSLVAFSAQCNFSGYKIPLHIIDAIRNGGLRQGGTQIRGAKVDTATTGDGNFYVCLDAASFVASNYCDLGRYKPDYVCISFYKMFGFPTGVGALIVSKRGQGVLHKRFYGGGTVKIAMSRLDFHEKRDGFAERFEDGTIPFLSIVSLLDSFRTLDRLVPSTSKRLSMQRVTVHVFQLAQYCHQSLKELHHANGRPLVRFYNHTDYQGMDRQGGIVTFNVLHDDGSFVGFAEIACIAAVYRVQLRTGCFCNPGACQWFLHLTDADVRRQFDAGHICSDYNDLIDGQPTGAVRLSFGYMTRKVDVDRAVAMFRDCYVTTRLKRIRLLEQAQQQLPRMLQHIPERLSPRLKRICIYPIKSCGAFEIRSQWELNSTGLKYDRLWMIVDANNVAVTQKHCPRLCLVRPIVHRSLQQLQLTFPDMKSINIPLEATRKEGAESIDSRKCQSTSICQEVVHGSDCGDAVSIWLNDCLNMEGLRLMRYNAHGGRCDEMGASKALTLVNQAQLLLVNRTSVHWLTRKMNALDEPLDCTVDRFRANLIIETPEPLDELTFEQLQICDMDFNVQGPCTRCHMICIDQHTGARTPEPLSTIARECGGKIRFGIYLHLKDDNVIDGIAMLQCGSPVTVTKRKDDS